MRAQFFTDLKGGTRHEGGGANPHVAATLLIRIGGDRPPARDQDSQSTQEAQGPKTGLLCTAYRPQ